MKRAPKGSVNDIFGTAYCFKRKLLRHLKWDVQLTKSQRVSATTAINSAATSVITITNTATTVHEYFIFLNYPNYYFNCNKL